MPASCITTKLVTQTLDLAPYIISQWPLSWVLQAYHIGEPFVSWSLHGSSSNNHLTLLECALYHQIQQQNSLTVLNSLTCTVYNFSLHSGHAFLEGLDAAFMFLFSSLVIFLMTVSMRVQFPSRFAFNAVENNAGLG